MHMRISAYAYNTINDIVIGVFVVQGKKKRGQQNTGMQGPPVVELNCWSFCCNARTLRHLASSVFFQIPLVHETVGSPEKGRPELVADTSSGLPGA